MRNQVKKEKWLGRKKGGKRESSKVLSKGVFLKERRLVVRTKLFGFKRTSHKRRKSFNHPFSLLLVFF
jgi:hypothetical protein